MPDPDVRVVGEVDDIDGRIIKVGVDYDSACWQAARQVPGDG